MSQTNGNSWNYHCQPSLTQPALANHKGKAAAIVGVVALGMLGAAPDYEQHLSLFSWGYWFVVIF